MGRRTTGARLRRRWTELDRGWQAVVVSYIVVGVVVLTV